MKKLAEKKTNNKGFSLVELIIVVAIMAVLIGVLAPQYMRYLEKTRLQKDNSAISEIANAIKNAGAEETVYDEIAAAGATGIKIEATHTANTNQVITFGTTAVEQELKVTIGSSFTTTSKAYKTGSDKLTFVATVDANGLVTVTVSNYIDSVGGSATTKTY